jgi:hypothetical protein
MKNCQPTILIAILLSSCRNDSSELQNQISKKDQIYEIFESSIIVPEKNKIESYDRFYYEKDGKLFGFYSKSKNRVGSRYFVEEKDIPYVGDGGCTYVFLRITKGDMKLESINCSGDA